MRIASHYDAGLCFEALWKKTEKYQYYQKMEYHLKHFLAVTTPENSNWKHARNLIK